MSSMRNVVQRRSHRERAQPLERKRLGLLEKHKDYSIRAKDWNKKKTVLKNLRQKAADRNEDEFSYKMLSRKGPGSALTTGNDEKRNRKWDGTVNGDRGNKSLSVDTVRFLKTQDTGYLRTMRNLQAKEVRQLEERAAVASSFVAQAGGGDDGDDEDDLGDFGLAPKRKAGPKKIVFAETAEDRDEAMEEDEGEDEDDDGDDSDDLAAKRARNAKKAKVQQAERLRRRLDKARQRLKTLTEAETQLDLQRARMAKTATVDVVQRKTGKRIKVRARKR